MIKKNIFFSYYGVFACPQDVEKFPAGRQTLFQFPFWIVVSVRMKDEFTFLNYDLLSISVSEKSLPQPNFHKKVNFFIRMKSKLLFIIMKTISVFSKAISEYVVPYRIMKKKTCAIF